MKHFKKIKKEFKKTKEIFQRGVIAEEIPVSLISKTSRLDLIFVTIYALIVITIHSFFNVTPIIQKILSLIGILLILFFISIRIFGLNGWKKIIKSIKTLKKNKIYNGNSKRI